MRSFSPVCRGAASVPTLSGCWAPWSCASRFFVLGLFLFEEAAESTYRVGGILPLRQCLGGAGGGSAGASELRLQHAGRKTADIGNKFWIGSRAVNQERHSRRTPSFTA